MARGPTIYDHMGRPIERRVLQTEVGGPTLTGVRQPLGTHPERGLTPARMVTILEQAEQGEPAEWYALAEAMEERDPHYASVLSTRKRAVAALDILVDAASDDARDVAAADMVRELVERDTIRDDLVDVLDALGKGASITEIVWRTEASRWMPDRLIWRDPRWLRWSRHDLTTPLLLADGHPLGQPLAPAKWIVHRPAIKSGLPVRGGLARAVAWVSLFKSYALKDWMTFAEAFGMPKRLGKYPASASEQDRRTLLRALAGIGVDFAAAIPEGMTVEMLETGITGSTDLYERLLAYLDQQVSKAVLGQTGTTDAIAGGHAVGRVHDDVREDIRDADARQLAAVLGRDLIRPMVDLNLGPPAHGYPRLRLVAPDDVPIDAKIRGLQLLVPMGLRVHASDARDMLGFADPDDDAELLMPPGGGAADQAPPSQALARGLRPPQATARAIAAAHDHDHGRSSIDDLVDELIGDDYAPQHSPEPAEPPPAQAAMASILDPLVAAIQAATSLEDLRLRLATLGEPDSGPLAEHLARASYATRLAGEVGAEIVDGLPPEIVDDLPPEEA